MSDNMILAINPGSTSTKIALFRGTEELSSIRVHHSRDNLALSVIDQIEERRRHVSQFISDNVEELDAVVGRGGVLAPLPSGVYEVNETMLRDLHGEFFGEHASNLGGILADEVAARYSINAYVVDPVVVDEMEEVAKLTGRPKMLRESRFHALNHKYVARAFAESLGKRYEEINVIVAHMGGGTSVGAHRRGLVVDVNNALYGDGPFSMERAGTVPTGCLAERCFSSGATISRVRYELAGGGGVVAHLGTNDLREARAMVEDGDDKAALVLEAMAYQVAKEISGLGAVLHGDVDGVILTGGMAADEELTSQIKSMVGYMSKVVVMAGEMEMVAMATGVDAVLRGEREAKEYLG
jgi:butyrate kinase